MNYNVILHQNFEKEYKQLAKKFNSLQSDVQKIIDNLDKELVLADDLGNGFKKIRLNIKSKGKGSSGGGRIITFETLIEINQRKILFCSIYNKTDFESINIEQLKKNLNL